MAALPAAGLLPQWRSARPSRIRWSGRTGRMTRVATSARTIPAASPTCFGIPIAIGTILAPNTLSRAMGSNGASRELSVGVVGAGFGGVGIGIRLRDAGIEDFTIFERGETVGGVWRANTYPGAACDVPSHLYSYSFAP